MKFILHGGALNRPLENNKIFFKTVADNLKQGDKILLVMYARDEKDWPKFLELANQNYEPYNKNFEILIADKNPEIFAQQIKACAAINVVGGNTFKLVSQIQKTPDFAQLIKGKLYAGSSAGAYKVCKYFYENDQDRLGEGLGILQIKCFAHWDESKQALVEKLDGFGQKLPIYKIAEGEFKIIEQ